MPAGHLKNMTTQYDALDRFETTVRGLHDSLGKKFHIKELSFDVESIYEMGDLSRLVKKLTDLGGFDATFVEEGIDAVHKLYYSVFSTNGKQYEFRTSSEGDFADLEPIFHVLEQIVKDHKPGYQYCFSNLEGGQVTTLVFGKTTDLLIAVDEGYPCSLPGSQWGWKEQWNRCIYSYVRMDKVPDFFDLRLKYYMALKELRERRFHVPDVTVNRIYIDDLFKKDTIDIVIDGAPLPVVSAAIHGTEVRCCWETWGVALAYTLVKYYNGQPALYNKEEKRTMLLSQQEYLHKAELAFKKKM